MSFTRADYPPLSTIAYVSTLTGVTFKPTDISGCQLWLDGADPAGTGVVPSNGTVLTSWIDKSGNAKNATGVNSPTVVTSAINSKSVVSYNGSSYSYSSIAANTFPSAMIIFIVYKVNGAVTYCAPLTRSTSNMGYPIDQYNGTRYLNGTGFTSAWSHASATSTTLFTQVILGTGNITEFVNGSTTSSLTSTFTYSDSASYVYIGTRDDKVTSFNGYICEAITYNNASMTLAQRQQVEGYLAWKWGLQASLPAGHPYVSTSPTGTISTLVSTLTLNLAGYIQLGANYVLKPQVPLSINPYYTGFNPISLSTLALWIDGADPLGTGVAPAQGTLLSSFKDKSGNNTPISTFSTTVGFPTYKVTANGALGAIQLAAGNGLLISSIAMTPYMSLYAVYSPINPSTGVSIEQGTNALANAGFLLISVSTSSTVFTITRTFVSSFTPTSLTNVIAFFDVKTGLAQTGSALTSWTNQVSSYSSLNLTSVNGSVTVGTYSSNAALKTILLSSGYIQNNGTAVAMRAFMCIINASSISGLDMLFSLWTIRSDFSYRRVQFPGGSDGNDVHNGADGQVYWNGSSAWNGSSFTITNSPIGSWNILFVRFASAQTTGIGISDPFLSRYYNGYIGDFIFFGTSYTTLEQQKAEGYLAWKWGLQANLPSGHPYYSAAP